ncbi:MAG: hypothetical protein FJZ01_18765 [Candidatus Sericytochromatia bacterium]|nr:hypothetical protein [Candidatus Tanganyikabacteria bacterium]
MRAILPRLGVCAMLALATGCGRPDAPGPAVPAAAAPARTAAAPAYALELPMTAPAVRPAGSARDLPHDRPEAFPDSAASLPAPRAPGLDALFSLQGGLVDVRDMASEPEPPEYGAQLVPVDTNLEAQHDAELWAPDAKQMYVAAGFWKTPLLGMTKHVFYSPSRDQKYILYFKLFKGIVKRKIVKASPRYKVAYDILRGAQDAWSYDLRRAHKVARDAYYRPTGSITVGVLVHPLVLGPCWVFLDNAEDQRPVIAVRASDGGVYRQGDLPFEAIKIIVTRSEDEDIFEPVSRGAASGR